MFENQNEWISGYVAKMLMNYLEQEQKYIVQLCNFHV